MKPDTTINGTPVVEFECRVFQLTMFFEFQLIGRETRELFLYEKNHLPLNGIKEGDKGYLVLERIFKHKPSIGENIEEFQLKLINGFPVVYEENFYCAEYEKNGSVCEQQCSKCAKAESRPSEPEQTWDETLRAYKHRFKGASILEEAVFNWLKENYNPPTPKNKPS